MTQLVLFVLLLYTFDSLYMQRYASCNLRSKVSFWLQSLMYPPHLGHLCTLSQLAAM